MKILGLAGKQGAGKDYGYEHLQMMMAPSGWRLRRIALADGVRREVASEVFQAVLAQDVALGNTDGLGQWTKPYTEGQRWLLQQWGTEYRRGQDPEYWVKYTMDYMQTNDTPDSLWVITDVRFSNEAEAIKAAGGHVAEVVAPWSVRADRLGISVDELKERSVHASEQIDVEADSVIISSQGLLLEDALMEWLGLPKTCILCRIAAVHVFHNNGDLFEPAS